MISAQEARALAQLSEKVISRVLEQVEQLIKNEASLGNSRLVVSGVAVPALEIKEASCFQKPSLSQQSPVCQLVAARLKDAGFKIDIESFEYRVGGGFGSMDDEPSTASEWRLVVKW